MGRKGTVRTERERRSAKTCWRWVMFIAFVCFLCVPVLGWPVLFVAAGNAGAMSLVYQALTGQWSSQPQQQCRKRKPRCRR